MVRTQLKSTPEEKKDSQKKKSSSSKKAETGIWPCKINGCNKEFAREADLKRHQRTTKLHSQPGFACPQCEATFTRTDALRRHQKSRHNGVIIDPGPPVQSEESNGETSRSRGATPKPKNKAHLPQAVAPGSGAIPGYYRQQGINAEFVVFVPPRTQGVIVDPNYAAGHPTSAARLAQPWGPPPWADGTQPVPPYPIPGAPPGYFAPYYHPGVPPLPLANAQFHPNAIAQPYAPSSSSPDGTCVPSDGEPEVPCSPKPPQGREVGRPDKPGSHAPAQSSAPVIDPSLDAPELHPNRKSPISLAITSAAMQAVLVETRRIATQSEGVANALGSRESSPHTYVSESAPAEVMKCADSNIPHVPSAPGHPSSTMLTEDGETMLHPAELLTQESLASPPPAEDS
ncbi:hypothetical protein BJY52DRAFT_1282696 [Lactarius psammicola]|nr:hypothetical protein BJY52DRAFT_1282696 [Lactarius psammicola]